MSRYKPRLRRAKQARSFLYPLSPAKRESLRGRKWLPLLKNAKNVPKKLDITQSASANVAQQTLLPLRRLYGLRLRSKQSLRHFYPRLKEKQFKKLFQRSNFSKLNSKDHLIQLLESRLDVVVYRMGFARTIFQARQFASHGTFAVNGFVQKAGGRSLKPGDLIEVVSKDSLRQAVADVVMDRFGEEPQALDYVPTHLLVDFETLSGVYVSPCSIQEVAYHAPVNLKHVKEFYL